MSDEALIHLDLATRKATTTPACAAMVERALESSALVCRVDDEASNAKAVEVHKILTSTESEIEKARKAAKAPLLDLGRSLDQVAEEAKADVAAEKMRIGQLTGSWAQVQMAKLRAAQNEARLIEEKAERERQEKLRAIAEQERLAKAKLDEQERAMRENIAKLNAEAAAAQSAKLDAEIKRQRDLAAAETAQAMDKVNDDAGRKNYEASQLKLAAQPVQVKGQVIKPDWDITVVDSYKLAMAHPSCVNITPRLTEIKALLDQGIMVAGIEAKEIVRSGVRTGGKAVEV